MGKRFGFLSMIALLAISIVGCSVIQKKKEEGTSVDYTVVKKADYPNEITDMIEEKKQEKFQMSYQSEGELYLIRGYGIQSTGGYSIQVEYVTETEGELHMKTALVGPENIEQSQNAISCPVIVVKMEYRDKKIIFD